LGGKEILDLKCFKSFRIIGTMVKQWLLQCSNQAKMKREKLMINQRRRR